ncbi:MAG: hypothetical protein PHR43_07840, partial [Dehalococcoidales bacterium]|nr:hypothetical protein [Dehalococcoidales bacterium]
MKNVLHWQARARIFVLLLAIVTLGGCVTPPAIPTFTPPSLPSFTPPTIPPFTPPVLPTPGTSAPTGAIRLPTAPKVTFTVTIPPATPPEDVIYLRTGWGQDIRMDRIDKLTWQADFAPPPGVPVTYGYNRNGVGYEASEEITPGDTEADWHQKRSVTANISQHVIQKDEVKKWRWLLNEPVPAKILPETTLFQPRIEGWTFQKGLAVIDYWWDIFRTNGETEATVQRILKDNANYVQYSPTWAVEITGQGIRLNKSAGYTYPDDAIRYEAQTARQAGLHVMFRNQVWMELPNEEVTRSRPAAWWESYYQTRRQYLMEMAQLAAAEGIEAMSIGSDSDTLCAFTSWGSAPPESIEKLVQDIREVRKIYSGKLYYDFNPGGLLQDTFEIDWAKWEPVLAELDFIGISSWKGVSSHEDPTLEELVKIGRA